MHLFGAFHRRRLSSIPLTVAFRPTRSDDLSSHSRTGWSATTHLLLHELLLLLLKIECFLLLGHWLARPHHLSVIHALHLANHTLHLIGHPVLHHLVLIGCLTHLVGVLLLRIDALLHHLVLLLHVLRVLPLVHLLVHVLSLVLLRLLHCRTLLLVKRSLLVLAMMLLIIHVLQLLSLVLALRPHLLLLHHVLWLTRHLSLVRIIAHLRHAHVSLLNLLLIGLLLRHHSLVGILLPVRILVG